MSDSQPSDPDTLFNEGLAHHRGGDVEKAEATYRRALALDPMHFDALHLLGVIAHQRQDYGRAVELIGMAISVNPNNPLYADAYCNRGTAFRALGKNADAVTCYTHAIKLRPNHAEAYFNRANAYRDLNRGAEALADFERAAKLSPGNSDTAYNRGLSLSAMQRQVDAIAAFEEAKRLKPDQPYLDGLLLFEKLHVCDWSGFAGDVASVSERIRRGERAAPSYPVLTFSGDPVVQRKAAEIWTNDRFPGKAGAAVPKHPPHSRIRVGYFCEAFREHPVSHQMAAVFENHDRRKFEVFAFSYGPDVDDAMRQRIKGAAEHFVDIAAIPDAEAAYMARQAEIDIAVDLTGHTGLARTGIFASRAAPTQINAIGYPGTMGAAYMDYILADAVVIPEASRSHYQEKVIYMPGCYQAAEAERGVASRSFSRTAIGLPREGFVFCSLDGNDKIQPDIFASWMRILKAVPDSTLLLHIEHVSAAPRLRTVAATHGITPERLAFSGRVSRTQYVARFQTADLYLDTLPHNSGVPGADALAAGLPVLTCAGETFVGRMSASRLKALGLPELVTTTLAEYEKQATALAQSPEQLAALKQRLAQNAGSHALFDVPRYTAALEDAYSRIYARASAGLAPDHIFI